MGVLLGGADEAELEHDPQERLHCVVAPGHRATRPATEVSRTTEMEYARGMHGERSEPPAAGRTPAPAASRPARTDARPRLVYFYSKTSGRSRHVDAYLAQIFQRRRNHDSFKLVRVLVEDHPEVVKRFGVRAIPTIVVVEGRRERARIESPRGVKAIEQALAPWLR